MSQERQSNIELLRIVAIVMVLMLHFNYQGLHPSILQGGVTPFSLSSIECHLIESFCISAVDIFVLISGYFSIKLSLRSVSRLYIRCFIIGLITYLVYALLTDSTLSVSALLGRLFAFSHNRWWFVISYLGLMIMSPVLNVGCERLDRKQYQIVLMLFSIVIMFFGWWKNEEATNAGYSLITFIYLYVLARYIRLHIPIDTILRYRWQWISMFLVSSICIMIGAFWHQGRLYTYDSPLTILSAVSLLLFAISIPFHNNVVNWVGSSVFAAYLVQDSPYLGKLWLYPYAREVMANNSYVAPIGVFVLFTGGVFAMSVILDKLFVMPILKRCKF